MTERVAADLVASLFFLLWIILSVIVFCFLILQAPHPRKKREKRRSGTIHFKSRIAELDKSVGNAVNSKYERFILSELIGKIMLIRIGVNDPHTIDVVELLTAPLEAIPAELSEGFTAEIRSFLLEGLSLFFNISEVGSRGRGDILRKIMVRSDDREMRARQISAVVRYASSLYDYMNGETRSHIHDQHLH